MATYAIGDIQGCYIELRELLDRCAFEPAHDRLWLVGDLVNRGPESLAVLRLLHALRDNVVCVLGNHDLHLLACAYGTKPRLRPVDTFGDVLTAADRDELLAWLRRQPLLHHDTRMGYTLVHAGLPREWDLAIASTQAARAEQMLRGTDFVALLDAMYTSRPAAWDPNAAPLAQCSFTVNALTRIRYCHADGRLDFNEKTALGTKQTDLLPWFDLPRRANRDLRIVFGHWSTLHLSADETRARGIVPLDTGCVWGGRLTAIRLEDEVVFTVPSRTKVPFT
ncbi:MAG: symmetrical bis(5'-nucleosyl)-tetraphosphatase [Gammaproteobacteria bacterium]|nr:symmetrical bis(5'-nucleosyl)-tetraphosphatase [Gammaproteobacteria bacterium]